MTLFQDPTYQRADATADAAESTILGVIAVLGIPTDNPNLTAKFLKAMTEARREAYRGTIASAFSDLKSAIEIMAQVTGQPVQDVQHEYRTALRLGRWALDVLSTKLQT